MAAGNKVVSFEFFPPKTPEGRAKLRETWQVGRARGVKLADDFIETRLKFAETLPYEMKASMAHDLEAGNKLEAPWLCGAVARMARDAGVPAPVNATVFAALKPYINGK